MSPEHRDRPARVGIDVTALAGFAQRRWTSRRTAVSPAANHLTTWNLSRWLVPNSRNGDFAITKPQVSDLQIVANRHLTPAT